MFDCSSRYRGVALNDKVLQGPDFINKLVGVLLRFRQKPVAIMGDIEAMYHQVTPSDRDVLRFLWWQDDYTGKHPEIYRMAVHLFGGIWSPSCASFALRRTADDYQHEVEPNIVKTVKHNFYVDDCLQSM